MSTCLQYSIHSICRICLDKLKFDSCYNLFAVPGLAKKLCMCTSLLVEAQDGLPHNICFVCYTRLSDMYEFQQQCVDSVQKFREMLASNIFISDENDVEVQNVGVVGENPVSFDPLLNHKLELIDNAEDVFKMLENVEKETEEPEPAEIALADRQVPILKVKANDKPGSQYSNDYSSNSDYFNDDEDDDFLPPQANDDSNDCSSSDDDKPLALRCRKNRRLTDGDDNTSNLSKKVNEKKSRTSRIECHVCHQGFKKPERYESHMKYHNDKLPHKCIVETCLKGFTTERSLRLHIEHYHAETLPSLSCPQEGCDQTFQRIHLLNCHLKKAHQLVKKASALKCNECDKVFRCSTSFKEHMYKHDGKELPFPCNICGKRFVINSALKKHLLRHAGIKNFMCSHCGIKKMTQAELNYHLNTHTEERTFKCTQCDYASNNRPNLRMHIKMVHDKIQDYPCQYCGKTFGKSSACKLHELIHRDEKRCECKVCGKQFLFPKSLKSHLMTHEKRIIRAFEVYRKRQIEAGVMLSDQPTPVLPDLSKRVKNSRDFNQKATDEILRVLQYTAIDSIPSVTLPSWSPQINFMMKEGSLVCPDCGQGFNFQANLKRHRRIVHEGIKDFPCRFCKKCFGKAETLKHHEMRHTGEKPHECETCGKRFTQYVVLKRHYKVHMNKPPPKIPNYMLEAQEELQMQEHAKQDAKRKIQEEIAEKAKEQLLEIKQRKLRNLPNLNDYVSVKKGKRNTAAAADNAEKCDT